MKLATIATTFLLAAAPLNAAVFLVDFSPAGGALNLGSSIYTQDHAVGVAALNAVGQPASSATGNEIGGGMSYDDVTNILTFDFAYGSAFGFTDLAGNFSTAHIHGPVTVNFPAANTGAGVAFGLDSFHTASGPNSGRFVGSQVLTAGQAADLFDNELYLNIHSSFAGGGEIRGQLVPVIPEPSAALLALTASLLAFRRRRAA